MPPAAAFAEPEEVSGITDPFELMVVIHPGLVRFGEHRRGLPRRRIQAQQTVGVLQTVELLNEHSPAARRPLSLRQVVLARIARDLQPGHSSSVGIHKSKTGGGVFLSGFRIGEGGDALIAAICLIHQREGFHVPGIELPENDPRAIRTPAKAVADEKLLLIHPVGCAIDELGGAVLCQCGDLHVGQVLNIKIVTLHIGHARAIR